MQADTHVTPPARTKRRLGIFVAVVSLVALGAAAWLWLWPGAAQPQTDGAGPKGKKGGEVQVVSALAAQGDVSLRLTANGTVTAQQAVEVRSQISATVKVVHIKEGQFVRKADPLFTLDMRTEAANLSKTEAQLAKDRGDLATAERHLQRQRELFGQKFLSQAELDTAQNQVDGLLGQIAVDQAAVETSRVALSYGEISAPISGRTGAISIYPGSLVQPNGQALVSITQIDPINVSFALPEREFSALQQEATKGEIKVSATLDSAPQDTHAGKVVFVDNAVDVASGTIRLKAEFRNSDKRLWPGMFVTVALAPHSVAGAITVPAQAVQIGPEKKFVYVVGDDRKVLLAPVKVRLIQDGLAVVEGIAAGARVVVEGAQNLRPGSVVVEASAGDPGGGKKAAHGEGKGERRKADKSGESVVGADTK